jgi:hypothetical protein
VPPNYSGGRRKTPVRAARWRRFGSPRSYARRRCARLWPPRCRPPFPPRESPLRPRPARALLTRPAPCRSVRPLPAHLRPALKSLARNRPDRQRPVECSLRRWWFPPAPAPRLATTSAACLPLRWPPSAYPAQIPASAARSPAVPATQRRSPLWSPPELPGPLPERLSALASEAGSTAWPPAPRQPTPRSQPNCCLQRPASLLAAVPSSATIVTAPQPMSPSQPASRSRASPALTPARAAWAAEIPATPSRPVSLSKPASPLQSPPAATPGNARLLPVAAMV